MLQAVAPVGLARGISVLSDEKVAPGKQSSATHGKVLTVLVKKLWRASPQSKIIDLSFYGVLVLVVLVSVSVCTKDDWCCGRCHCLAPQPARRGISTCGIAVSVLVLPFAR